MPLELDHLQRAIAALEGGLKRTLDDEVMGKLDDIAQNTMRSGVIQHFEFTYELCRVLTERWLRENYGSDVLRASRREILRIAGERGLIDGVERWFEYHQERNRTTHRYDEEVLSLICSTVPQFIEDAKLLLGNLRQTDAS